MAVASIDGQTLTGTIVVIYEGDGAGMIQTKGKPRRRMRFLKSDLQGLAFGFHLLGVDVRFDCEVGGGGLLPRRVRLDI